MDKTMAVADESVYEYAVDVPEEPVTREPQSAALQADTDGESLLLSKYNAYVNQACTDPWTGEPYAAQVDYMSFEEFRKQEEQVLLPSDENVAHGGRKGEEEEEGDDKVPPSAGGGAGGSAKETEPSAAPVTVRNTEGNDPRIDRYVRYTTVLAIVLVRTGWC